MCQHVLQQPAAADTQVSQQAAVQPICSHLDFHGNEPAPAASPRLAQTQLSKVSLPASKPTSSKAGAVAPTTHAAQTPEAEQPKAASSAVQTPGAASTAARVAATATSHSRVSTVQHLDPSTL